MNGLVFGTSSHAALEADILRGGPARLSAFALAHNVASQNEVQPTLDRLSAVGGRILSKWRGAAARPVPGLCRRSRQACLGDHLVPAWRTDGQDLVQFGLSATGRAAVDSK